MSSLTLANTAYLLLKQMDHSSSESILIKLRLIIKILSVDDRVVGLASNDETFSDFEDGLQYFTALENRQDLIITRNLKDFKGSKLPVLTAKRDLKIN